MERNLHLRLSGIILSAGAVFGLILSLVCLVWLWVGKDGVMGQVSGTAALFGSGLEAAHELASAAGKPLDEAARDMETVHTMLNNISGTLEESSGVFDSASALIGGDMVDSVSHTQSALASVEKSARAVDSILNKINSIPLLGPWMGGGVYDPELPLQASVADVSRSMNGLPDALTKVSRDLDVSSANIATIRAEVEVLGEQVGAIRGGLAEAQGAVEQYQARLKDAQARYGAFEKRLPGMINGVYTALTLALVWMLMVSAGMGSYGVYLLR